MEAITLSGALRLLKKAVSNKQVRVFALSEREYTDIRHLYIGARLKRGNTSYQGELLPPTISTQPTCQYYAISVSAVSGTDRFRTLNQKNTARHISIWHDYHIQL